MLPKSAMDLLPTDPADIAIMEARASALAKKTSPEIVTENISAYVKFHLSENQAYGIPYSCIQEIILKPSITKIPQAPNYIAGLINWRGILLTIIDLHNLFNIALSNTNSNQYIIIATCNETAIGFMTGTIDGSYQFNLSLLDQPLASKGNLKSEYVAGIHDGTVSILNPDQIVIDVKQLLK